MRAELNPYVGPVPFRRRDENRFFGRDGEVSELSSLVAAYPATLLYAQSGAGKSSMLEAKLLPLLEARGAEVLGPARVSGGNRPRGVNVFVYNLLTSLAGRESRRLTKITISEYLAALKPPEGETSIRPLRILVIDQFEELFTNLPDQWAARREFFEQIGNALDADRRLRVLFAMREESIASLDPFVDELPNGLRMRFRLERLRPEQALDAIVRPLASTEVRFEPGVAEALVERLRVGAAPRSGKKKRDATLSEYVEPLHLQIVCSRLWLAIPEDATRIDSRALKAYGDVEDALTAYYNDTAKAVAEECTLPEGALRNRVERAFITQESTRGSVRVDSSGGAAGLSAAIIKGLMTRYLIRLETRGGAPWYELSHDRFIEPILKSNEAWRMRQEHSEYHRELEAKAEDWARREKPMRGRTMLLHGEELQEAKTWLTTSEADQYGVSDLAKEFVAASEAVRTRQRDRQRIIVAGSTVVGLLLAVLIWLFTRSETARKSFEESMSKVETEVARSMLNESRPVDALAWALRAISKSPDVSIDPKARTALLEALTATVQSTWIRRDEDIRAIDLSADGTHALTITPHQVCWTDLATNRDICPSGIGDVGSWRWGGFSPGGRYVWAAADPDFDKGGRIGEWTFRVWDVARGTLLPNMSREMLLPSAWSRDDAYFAVAVDGSLSLYEMPDLRLIRSTPAANVSALEFLPDHRIATAGRSGVRVYNVPDLVKTIDVAVSAGYVHGVDVSRDQRFAVLRQAFKSPSIVDLRSSKVRIMTRLANADVAFFPPDPALVVFVNDGLIYRVRLANATVLSPIHRIASKSAKAIQSGYAYGWESGNSDTYVTIVNLATPERAIRKVLPNTTVDDLTMSEDGKKLLTRSERIARVWKVSGGANIRVDASLSELRKLGCRQFKLLKSGKLEPEVSKACQGL